MKSWFRSLVISIQYFTRIPLPINVNFDDKTVPKAIFFYPFVGWIIGLLTFGLYKLTHNLFPELLLSVLIISFTYWLTGAIHADGWMDVMDGIGSSRDKERTLEIMKDSCVGAMGVAGFVVLFALKVASLVALMDTPYIFSALILSPILGRWSILLGIYLFSYAREQGLSKHFKEWLTLPKLLISLIWLVPLIWLCPNFYLILLVVILFLLLASSYFTKKLGGLTGDVYGFIIEGCEVLIWITLILLMR